MQGSDPTIAAPAADTRVEGSDPSPGIALIGTLDTKGAEYAYVRDRIRERGSDVLVMDLGVLGDPPFTPRLSRGAALCLFGAPQKLRV